MKLKKALIILAAFFINQDTYAGQAGGDAQGAPAWKQAKLSEVEQNAARALVEKEFAITIDQLMDPATGGLCLEQLADNTVAMGGEMASRLGLITGEGLAGQIDRNEVTMAEVEAKITEMSAMRIANCSLAYLPQNLN